MAARRVAAALLVVAVLASVAMLAVAPGDSHDSVAVPAVAPSTISPTQVLRAPRRRAGPTRHRAVGARLLRRVLLRESPGGRVVRALERRTEFGSPHVLAVVGEQQGWLAVLSHHMPNSRAGWIQATGAELLSEPYALRADLSTRELVVRREGRTVRRVTVAIGRPGTRTPTGRFAITDALLIGRAGSPYGCCALALSGRQPNVPQGWSGGDRLAIHGTTNEATLGTPASSGCLRASEADMRWLLSHVPLGTTVRIRA